MKSIHKKKNASARASKAEALKKTLYCAGAGAALTVLISLAAAWAALKISDPLPMVRTASAVCVLMGAALSGVLGCRGGKGFVKGLYAGAAYTLIAVFASLLAGGGDGTARLYMFASAVAGTLIGAGLAHGKKPSARKRVKRLTGR